MTTANCACGARWTGLRIEHCTECHETFSGSTSGDRHRIGEHHITHGPDRRRCRTPEEMRKLGMEQNSRGQWTNGGTSPWSTSQAKEATC